MAITSDVKLYCYNEALRIIGERKLASVSENREPRRVLDSAWGAGAEGVIDCLARADWNFATRARKLEYDPSIETAFGAAYAFSKPDDIARLTTISLDEYFSDPLVATQYRDEAGYWICDYQTLYVRYVSDDGDYGLNSGLWPVPFKRFVGAFLAYEACERLTGSASLQKKAMFQMDDQRKHATSRDAMDEGVKFLPAGSWTRSRSMGGNRDRGVKTSL